jgi:hypothetical protein
MHHCKEYQENAGRPKARKYVDLASESLMSWHSSIPMVIVVEYYSLSFLMQLCRERYKLKKNMRDYSITSACDSWNGPEVTLHIPLTNRDAPV